MTRSICDANFKRYGLTCTPDIYNFTLKNDGSEFLILASDGFWNVFSLQDACLQVIEAKKLVREPKGISRYLVESVYKKQASMRMM